ncbi:hypothetical protein NEOLEDRAFT_1129049 [Neolentinus lepideus HHB14362 ss-1]|uniref:FIST domain-containing protein n=1 Tax=Neolentinus lepideus HHB14362 ss-1 TaxID=1314782 RepID=A0A165UWU4_9AGAM|nr:hypothetical protein NEOLEDRAFT_1129049 [Neolentinus lepideus HHB14362 ss-1]
MTIIHASTALFSRPEHLSRYLSRLPKIYRENILFFALAANASSESELSALLADLTSFAPLNVGCLSGVLSQKPALVSCSFAVFDKSTSTIFRSTIPGRAEPQVGRWHAFRKKGEPTPPPGSYSVGLNEDINWEDVWKRDVGGNELPDALKELRPESVTGVAYLSDSSPEGLSNALNDFPSANKLGLIASSTPFLTGRPFTLFRNGEIHSDGAVGIATTKHSTASNVEFHGLRAITDVHQITRSDGNLVQELDGSNPTGLLLNAIRKSGAGNGLAQDEEYFLGVLRNDRLWQVYRIMSGDPSRGTMSLESGVAPPVGASVKLYHLQKDSRADENPVALSSPSPRAITLLSKPDSQDNAAAKTGDDGELDVREDTFVAASENGWILSRSVGNSPEEAWRCTLRHGKASVQWV